MRLLRVGSQRYLAQDVCDALPSMPTLTTVELFDAHCTRLDLLPSLPQLSTLRFKFSQHQHVEAA